MARTGDLAKRAVLQALAVEQPVVGAGRSKVRIGGAVVHVRFCSANAAAPEKFKFNINPNSLAADFELWICGEESRYYLAPITVIHQMHRHPESYPDRHHPNITIVSLDASTHRVTYARGGEAMDFRPYFRRQLTAD